MFLMKRTNKLFYFILLLSFFSGCYYDNEEYLYPSVNQNYQCDTTNVSLTLAIMPILESKCLVCHGFTSAAGLGAGINLETYSELKIFVNNGKLEGSVSHLPGYAEMPKGSSKLDNCSLAQISAWINQGALNN